jgi:hypothetical protein
MRVFPVTVETSHLSNVGSRMRPPLRRRDHLLLFALFGSAFAYFMHGALTGDLYIPYRRSGGT